MTVTRITASEVDESALRAMGERYRAIDPQLPERGFADGARLLVAGDPAHAYGASTVERFAEADAEAIWGAARRAALELRWDGDAEAVEEMLAEWIAEVRPELAGPAPGGDTSDWDSALTVTVPSRDSGLVRPLLSQGFAVVDIEAIRITRRAADATGALERLERTGVSLRPATLADAGLIAEMDTELLEHETQHGGVTARPGATDTLRAGIEERLSEDLDWTWIAAQGGVDVGYLSIEVGKDRHLERVSGGGPVAFVQAMYLRPGVRGGGIGEAIVDFGHGRLEEAGYDRILLNYSALNPRSGPFWCRMGYRPLWSVWQRRPAR